ncbi:hypothetical protein ACLIJR_17580 [Hydrogenophaga sp. XSHU_21]
MLYALNWFVVLLLLGLWSLAAWAFHAVGVWTVQNAGALGGAATEAATGAAAGVGQLEVPPWLAPWLPPELIESVVALVAPVGALVEGLLQSAPALAGAVGVISWGIWGLGAFTLVALGAGAHIVIAMWRRKAPRKLAI